MKLSYTIMYVENVATTMDFYSSAFNLKKEFLSEGQDYGEMITGDTKLGFAQHQLVATHGFDYQKMTLEMKPASIEIGFTTAEVEQAFNHAIQNGATLVSKPNLKPWGQTVSIVRDCNGFLVEISSPM
jgi:lactoylglutathione lyase